MSGDDLYTNNEREYPMTTNTAPTILEWSEPTPSNGGRSANTWMPVLADLKARPGEWALVHRVELTSTLDKAAREKEINKARAYGETLRQRYGCEKVSRATGDVVRVWLRYPSG